MGTTEAERRAVELSSVDPDSSEHAEALAQLAIGVWWDGLIEEATRLIENAVATAHRSGSASAIARAHGARSHLRLMEYDLEQADLDCTVCWEQAMASGDPEDIGGAYGVRLNLLHARGDLRRLLVVAQDRYAWSGGVGLTGFAVAKLAIVLIAVGDLTEAEGIVRAGLAASGSTSAEVTIRLHAAMLAARRGANDAARNHVLRALELFPTSRSGHGRWRVGPWPRCCWLRATRSGRSSSSSVCCP